MPGVRAVGMVGREWKSSSAGSACRYSRVRVGIRCSPCRPHSTVDLVARGVRGQGLSSLRLPSFAAGVRHTLLSSVRVSGAQYCPLGLHALWGLRAAGVVGAVPWGGGLPLL